MVQQLAEHNEIRSELCLIHLERGVNVIKGSNCITPVTVMLLGG